MHDTMDNTTHVSNSTMTNHETHQENRSDSTNKKAGEEEVPTMHQDQEGSSLPIDTTHSQQAHETTGTPDPTADSSTFRRDEHVLPRLLRLLDRGDAPTSLDPTDLDWATAHLAECAACRAELAVLGQMAADPALEEVLQHVLGSATASPAPDDADLAWYVTVRQEQGAEVADAQFPEIAVHLAECAECQDMVSELKGLLQQVAEDEAAEHVPAARGAVTSLPTGDLSLESQAGQDDPTTSPALPVASRPSIWIAGAEQVRRLVAAIEVSVGRARWSLRSGSAALEQVLLQSRVVPSLSGDPRPAFRDSTTRAEGMADEEELREAGAVAKMFEEQQFALDLHDDGPREAREPWVQVHIGLRPLSANRISGELSARLVAAPDDPGEPAFGIAWHISRAVDSQATNKNNGGLPLPVPEGSTGADGRSGFYLRGAGDYEIALEGIHGMWVVPLHVHVLASPAAPEMSPSD